MKNVLTNCRLVIEIVHSTIHAVIEVIVRIATMDNGHVHVNSGGTDPDVIFVSLKMVDDRKNVSCFLETTSGKQVIALGSILAAFLIIFYALELYHYIRRRKEKK